MDNNGKKYNVSIKLGLTRISLYQVYSKLKGCHTPTPETKGVKGKAWGYENWWMTMIGGIWKLLMVNGSVYKPKT